MLVDSGNDDLIHVVVVAVAADVLTEVVVVAVEDGVIVFARGRGLMRFEFLLRCSGSYAC